MRKLISLAFLLVVLLIVLSSCRDNSRYDELQEEYDKLSEQYYDLEEEKYSIENEYNDLQNKYEDLDTKYSLLEEKYYKSSDIVDKLYDHLSDCETLMIYFADDYMLDDPSERPSFAEAQSSWDSFESFILKLY